MQANEDGVRRGLDLKRRLSLQLRDWGFDPVLCYYACLKDQLKNWSANQAFRAAHPEQVLPPARLMFDVCGSTRAEYFVESGRTMATYLWSAIEKWTPRASLVCEWGCGPGRVLLPLTALDATKKWWFVGTDMHAPSIRWAQSVQDGHMAFHRNDISPPLAMSDANVDFVYAISVFTHLSEPLSRAWFAEIMRILKSGGVFWFSTHGGKRHLRELNPAQQDALKRGEFVAIDNKHDGSQGYGGIHCPEWMRSMIASSAALLLAYQPEEYQGFQDVWIVRKPE